jgi:type IV secretion system protein VirD4
VSPQRQGVGDGTLIGALVALFGACGAFWLATGIGGYLSHGRWPDIGFTGTAPGIRRLVTNPEDPMGAWPRSVAAQLPSPVMFYSVLAALILLLVVVVVLAARLGYRHRGGGEPASSRRDVIARNLSAAAVRERAAAHPSVARAAAAGGLFGSPDPNGRANRRRAVPGIHLGREPEYGIELYGSLEDSYCVLGPPRSGKTVGLVTGAVLDAAGSVVVTSTHPDTLRNTYRQRERRGPVHVFDPADLAGWPDRLRWAPEHGCEDPATAIRRAQAFTASVAPAAPAVQTVVRCYLHACAVDNRGSRQLRAWVADPSHAEPLSVLRSSSLAAEGSAAELAELARLDGAERAAVWSGVRDAFAWLSDPRVVESCSPGRTDVFDPSYLLGQQGTLYLIGSAATEPSTASLIAALVEDVVELGRRVAARSPDGRLDPPLLVMLDDAATVAPLPSIVGLLSEGGGLGMTPVAVLQSVAQATARWGDANTLALWQASTVKVVLGGLATARALEPGPAGLEGELTNLGHGEAVVLHPATGPVVARLAPWWERPGAPPSSPRTRPAMAPAPGSSTSPTISPTPADGSS